MRSGTSGYVGAANKVSRKRRLGVLAAAVASVFAIKTTSAVDYSWDGVGTPGVAPNGGSGVWSVSGMNWTNDAGATYIAWPNLDPNADKAIFGGIGGTVSLGSGIFVNVIDFAGTDATSFNYSLDNGGNPANTLTLSGTAPMLRVIDAAHVATISASIAGTGGLTTGGAGQILLQGAHSVTGGIRVVGGTLALGVGASLDVSNNLTIQSGGTFALGTSSQVFGAVALEQGNISGGTISASSYAVQEGRISSSLTGAAAALTKSGAGTVVLSGSNSYTGDTTISGGVLATASSNALGAGAITLAGGTLQIGDTPTAAGLRGEYYSGTPNPLNVSNINPQFVSMDAFSARYTTPTLTAPTTTNVFDPGQPRTTIDWPTASTTANPFADQGFDVTGEQIAARWTGKIKIENAGVHQFFTASDDGSMLFIDGKLVVNSNFFQGRTERNGFIDLTAGYHDIVMLHYEGGGDASMTASWIPVGGTREVLPNSVLFQNPAGAASLTSSQPVTVTADSTLDLSLTAPASTNTLGGLTRAGNNTLTILGQGRNASFAGTTLSGVAGDNIGFASDANLNLGAVSDGSSTGITLTKSGVGTLALDNPGNDLDGTTLDIQRGTVRVSASGASNSLGGAAVNLGGGTLSVSSSGGATIAVPVTISDSSTIERVGNGSDTWTGTIGAIPGGDSLTVSVSGGSLSLPGAVSGAGTLVKMGRGTLALGGSAGNSMGNTVVNAGTVTLGKSAGNATGNLTLNFGRAQLGGNEQIANSATVSLNGGGVLDLAGNIETIAALNATGGTVTAGTLNVGTVSKTGRNTATIHSRLVSPGSTLAVSGGTLRLTNTAAGAGANDLSGVTINVTSTGNLAVSRAAGGSNPIGSNTVNLNNGTLTLNGSTSHEVGGLAAQVWRSLPINIQSDNQLADVGQLQYSRRGLLAFESLAALESTFDVLMDVPWGAGALTQSINFPANAVGTVGFSANQPNGFNSGVFNLGAKWSGKIDIATAGVHQFFTSSDDGAMVFIDGQVVSYGNFFGAVTERSGSVNLTAGLHDITIAYYQGTGGGDMSASWLPPGGTKQLIPGSVLLAPTLANTNPIIATGNSTINVADSAQANVGPLTVTGQLNVVGGTVIPSSTTFNGNVTILTTGGGLVTNGVTEVNGPVSIDKRGGGTLALNGGGVTGALNINGGFIDIDGASNHTATNINSTGTLRMGHADALNPSSGHTVNVNTGGTLDVMVANANLSKVIINPGARLSLGAAQSTAAGAILPDAPIAGTLEVRGFDIGSNYSTQMASGSTISQLTGGANRIWASNVELLGSGQVNVSTSGNVTTFNGTVSGSAGLTLVSGTEVRLEGFIGYTGPTIVEAGTLKSRNNGNLHSTSEIHTYGGEIWADDGVAGTGGDRFSNSGHIYLHAGGLRHFATSGSTASGETFGTVHALGGVTIAVQQSDGVQANTGGNLTINELERPIGGRINFTPTGTGNVLGTHGRIYIGTISQAGSAPINIASTLNDGMLGGGITVGNEFATYDTGTLNNRIIGVRALTGHRATADSVATPWLETENIRRVITATETLFGSKTINSLTISNNAARDFDLGANSLIIDSGGFSQFGGGALTVIGTGSLTAGVDPVTLTSELFLLAANTINVNATITNNGSTSTALTIGGGGTIRLANTGNSFDGGINMSSSTLLAQSTGNTGNVMGTNALNFTGNGTVNLRDIGAGSNGTISYGNSVNVFSNAIFSVDRPAGANVNNTFQMGDLMMEAGRSLTVNGGNGYRLSFGTTTLKGNANFIINSAETSLGSLNDNGAPITLTKSGGSVLHLNSLASSWLGNVVINGGTVLVNDPNALGSGAPSVIVNNGGIFGVGVGNQDLSNVVFNVGSGLRLNADMDSSIPQTVPSAALSVLEIGATIGGNYDNIALNPAGAVVRTVSPAAVTYNSDLALPGTVQFETNTAATTFTGVITGSTGVLIKAGGNVMNLSPAAGTNTYAGGTFVMGGTLNANGANTLGTGPVTVTAGTLGYNAADAAGGSVITANGTTPQTLVGQINLGNTISGIGNDRFDVAANNVIGGDGQRLAMLSRGTNITLAPGAIVAHHDVNPSLTIQDLGTTPDLFFGIGTVGNTPNWAGTNLVIGANTPWMGVSTDRSSRSFISGDIIVDDGSAGGTQAATFPTMRIQSVNGAGITMTLGNGTNGVDNIDIVKSQAGNGQVEVRLGGRIAFNATNRDFSGVSKFVAEYGTFVALNAVNTLGTPPAAGAPAVTLELLDGSVLDIGGTPGTPAPGALNGNLLVRRGAVVRVDDANQFQNAVGGIFADPGAIFMLRSNVNIVQNATPQLMGTNQPGATGLAKADGAIFRLEFDNIANLDNATSNAGIFSLVGGDRPQTGLTLSAVPGMLSGGLTIFDNVSRTFTPGAGNLNIGAGGAFFSSNASANGTFTLTIGGTIVVLAPNAPITIGSEKIDFFDKNGHVQINAPFTGNALGSITKITTGDFVLNNASPGVSGRLVSGDIVVGGGAGQLRLGAANNTLSARLIAGTVANNIILNDRTRAEVNVDLTPAGRAQVAQKFTLVGGLHTANNKLLVQRQGGANTGLDMTDVTFAGGSLVAIDEANTDVRVNAKLAGDATVTRTAASDPFDFTNIASTVAGQRRTLVIGRTADTHDYYAVQETNAADGNVSSDITIDLVRGGLRLNAGSTVGAGTIIDNLGASRITPLPDGTTNLGATMGGIEVRAGQNGTGALGGGTVNLGGFQGVRFFVDESNAAQIVNNPSTAFNVVANSNGIIAADRGVTGATPGRVQINSVNVGANGELTLGSGNNAIMQVAAVNMAGPGTITNLTSDTNVRVGAVNAGANKVTFDGTRRTQVTGAITASELAVPGHLEINPGSGNTSSFGGPVSVRGSLTAGSGTADFGTTVINGTPADTAVAGLREGRLAGAMDTGTDNPGTYVRPGPIQPQLFANGPGNYNVTGWADNTTYVYTGQVNVPDSNGDGTGTIAFGESFDDQVQIKVDGLEVLRDPLWNNSTSSGGVTLSAGWHDVEMRFGQGTGGAGPSSPGQGGWNAGLGVGIQIGNTGPFDNRTDGSPANTAGALQSRYVAPMDNGTGNLFRVLVPASGDVNVSAGATLSAGGLANIVNANLNGAAGSTATLSLTPTAAPVTSTVTNVSAIGDAAVSFGATSPISAGNLNVAAAANLALGGGGTLNVGTGHSLGDGSNTAINNAKLVLNGTAGTGDGGVTVNASGILAGNAHVRGAVTVNNGGHVAPGNSVGLMTFGAFTLNSGSLLDIEGDGGGFDRINVVNDTGFNIAGPSTINLSDLGGVAVGEYVLIDYSVGFLGNFSDLLLASPALSGYSVSLINDTADTSIKLSVAAGGPPQWNVDADGRWDVADNWDPAVVPGGVTSGASFLGKITAPRTVTLDGDRIVGSINFDNANAYTIAQGSSGTLRIGGASSNGSVSVGLGSHTISSSVAVDGNTSIVVGPTGALTLSGGLQVASGKSISKGGDGVLNISGAQQHAAGTSLTVSRGTVNLNSNAGNGALQSNLSLSVTGNANDAAATVVVNAAQDLAGLSVAHAANGTQTLDLKSPAAAGGFNAIRVFAADLQAAKLALYDSIVNANRAGAVDPLDGIRDSNLHSGSGIGIASMSDHVLIRATRRGDLNLDGSVSIADFIDLASNFNTIGTATWEEGDINYDRNVTIADFIDLAANFNSSYAGSLGEISDSDHQVLASFASSIGVDPSVIGSAVPEPGTLSVLAIGAIGLLGRRRRSRKM